MTCDSVKRIVQHFISLFYIYLTKSKEVWSGPGSYKLAVNLSILYRTLKTKAGGEKNVGIFTIWCVFSCTRFRSGDQIILAEHMKVKVDVMYLTVWHIIAWLQICCCTKCYFLSSLIVWVWSFQAFPLWVLQTLCFCLSFYHFYNSFFTSTSIVGDFFFYLHLCMTWAKGFACIWESVACS